MAQEKEPVTIGQLFSLRKLEEYILPYWPLLLLYLLIFSSLGVLYLKLKSPVYEINASILIKDEKKSSDQLKSLDPLNIYNSVKLVENEIEIINSRSVLSEVISKNGHDCKVSHNTNPILSYFYRPPVRIQLLTKQKLNEEVTILALYDSYRKTLSLEGVEYSVLKPIETKYGQMIVTLNDTKTPNKNNTTELIIEVLPTDIQVAELHKKLNISTPNKLSTIINISLHHTDPVAGKHILDQLILEYNRKNSNNKNKLAQNTLDFVNDRMLLVQNQLDSVELDIQELKSSNSIVDLSDQSRIFLEKVSDIDANLSQINIKLAVLDQIESYISTNSPENGMAFSTLGIDDPVLIQLMNNYLETNRELSKLRSTSATNNPLVVSVRNSASTLAKNITDIIANQRKSLNTSKLKLERESAIFTSRVNQIPQKEKKLLDVSRQQQIKNNIYSFLLQKREETALAYASSISDSQIIDPAVVNPIPVSPKWYIVLPISILFSLLAFLLHILKKDFLTKKVKFRNQIEESFDLPVSAEISHVSKKIRQHILNESLYKTFKDQIKRMAYSAGILHLNTPHKTILVTSSIPNEGKTFIATNLAYNLSELNRKILLLDLDLRRNKLTHNFNLQGSEGFSEWIFQTDVQPTDYIYETEYNNMHIMPSGRNQTDVTEILLSKGIADNLKILSSLYDYIIIDTPPIDPVNDAFLLSDLADKIIYIIRHNHTPKTIMTNTSFLKKIKSMKNTAIIFNDVKSRGFVNKYYGNTFGYGYESVYYGKKRYENM